MPLHGGIRRSVYFSFGWNLMTDAPTIRAFSADEWRVYRDLRLRALADSPDAFGSTLAEEEGRLDTEWARRLASSADSRVNLPLVAQVRGEPIGLAWGRIEMSDPDVAALYQMWVVSMSGLASSPWENRNHSGQDRSCWRNRCDLHWRWPTRRCMADARGRGIESSCRES